MCVKKRKTTVILTLMFVSLLIVFEASLIFFSAFYQEIHNYPRIENGVMDFTGYDYHDAYISGFTIQGEWELFYNKWIITDGSDDAPDGVITLPGVWTDVKLNGKKLPKTGYASFRVTVAGLQAGDRFRVVTYSSPGAYRVFINGELNTVSGKLSKNASETFSTGRVNETHSYSVTEGGVISIVVEISANADGGLFDAPNLSLSGGGTNLYDRFYTILTYMVTGIIFAYLIFSIILNFGFYRKQKRFSSSLLLLVVFLHFFTSKECYYKFSQLLSFINYAVIRQISFISGILVIAVFVYHLLREKTIAMPKAGIYTMALSNLAFAALYYIFAGTRYQIIAVVLGFISLSYIFYLLSGAIRKRVKFSAVNTSMLLFLTALIIAECFDNLGWLIFTMETPTSIILLLFVLSVTAMNFISIRDSTASALNAVVLEKENESIKHQALRAQIKPHFIFNVLSSIQSLYKKDAAKGDEAITRFASHLRRNIDADNYDLVPFETEIKNIENYIGLENLRRDTKSTLILDIDFSDFEVPILSLQPLVENAIKYAETENKADGYIRITSKRLNEDIIIEIADNGNGFDAGNIRPDAAGLKNCAGRFKYLLNAEMSVNSAVGKGTVLTVRIPADEKN